MKRYLVFLLAGLLFGTFIWLFGPALVSGIGTWTIGILYFPQTILGTTPTVDGGPLSSLIAGSTNIIGWTMIVFVILVIFDLVVIRKH